MKCLAAYILPRTLSGKMTDKMIGIFAQLEWTVYTVLYISRLLWFETKSNLAVRFFDYQLFIIKCINIYEEL